MKHIKVKIMYFLDLPQTPSGLFLTICLLLSSCHFPHLGVDIPEGEAGMRTASPWAMDHELKLSVHYRSFVSTRPQNH